MLSIEPSIFFVDDKRNEVDEIVNIYKNKGFGVKFYNADPIDGDEVPNSNTHSDALLVFLDIYFNAERVLDEEKCAEWVSGIVREGSFFILVIWSQDTDEADKVISKLKESKRWPYVSIIKQKSDYQTGDREWDFNRLDEDIQKTLDKNPELLELASWKISIKRASNLIIGHLSKEEQPNTLTSRLQKIILGHGGSSILSENNYTEKQEILFDALDNILISNSKNTRPSQEIAEQNKDRLYNIDEKIEGEIDTILNSWFHFKIHPLPIDQNKISPGLVCRVTDEAIIGQYGLLDDKIIADYLSIQIEESKKEGSRTKIENICVLISRPCDIAQNKYGKNLILLSGLKIINPLRKGGEGKSKNNMKVSGTIPASLKSYDHLYFTATQNDAAILFDFRYPYSIPKDKFVRDFEKVNAFSKELLSEIQVEYSAYSSRLGITQIY